MRRHHWPPHACKHPHPTCVHLATAPRPQNKFKNNDWSAIVTLFDELNKNLEKVQKLAFATPKAYIRILGELEDYLTQSLANKEQKKKMSATNSKALNTMRQRLKKHNAQFAEQLAQYREDPAAFGSDADDAEEEEESSSSSEGGSGAEDEGEERVDKRLGARSAWLGAWGTVGGWGGWLCGICWLQKIA